MTARYFVVLKSKKCKLSNIFSVFWLHLFCVSKGVVKTAECGGTHEGEGKEESTQTVLRECRKQKEDRGRKSQFSEDPQTLLFSQLCLAAL